jgi:hypothetical protein
LTTSPFRLLKTNFALRENEPPPTILFRRDFKEHVRGVLRPSVRLFVVYDAERLPYERSMRGSQAGWWITMFARFVPDGAVINLNLWSRTGLILTEKATDEPGEGTMMKCDLQIPHEAQFVELWFMNSGDSGRTYFDSDYGKNYRFEFTALQVDILDAWVKERDQKTTAEASSGQLQVRIAADRRVTAISINYFYWNTGVNPPVRGRIDLKTTSTEESDRSIWENDPISVPTGTAVNFDVEYVVNGRPQIDDNSGRHFLIPDRPKPRKIAANKNG